MRPTEVHDLLISVRAGEIDVEDALRQLRALPVDDLGFARLDTHRELRQGMPEAIYAEGKTVHEVVTIAGRLLETTTSPVLATRCRPEAARALVEAFPDATHHEAARLVVLRSDAGKDTADRPSGKVAVVCAGTSDIPVAEEAAVTAEALGIEVERAFDVGVAGLHRVLAIQGQLREVDAVIVIAGMEGALASIVGGLSPAPVVAVPTSIGYGAAFEGLAALLAMLNACAAGIVVTNIDNGFGAALFALRLLGTRAR